MTLVPSSFYDKDCAREYLAQVVDIDVDTKINSVFLEQFDAYFVYAGLEKPALLYLLQHLLDISEYNKVLCDWDGKVLSLCIAQGKTLLLSNTFGAEDFVTALYYILLSMKSLQLNPEITTLYSSSNITVEDQVKVYNYFKDFKFLCE